jgi:hypothetical protein
MRIFNPDGQAAPRKVLVQIGRTEPVTWDTDKIAAMIRQMYAEHRPQYRPADPAVVASPTGAWPRPPPR